MNSLTPEARLHANEFGLTDELLQKLSQQFEAVFHFARADGPIVMIQVFQDLIRFGMIDISKEHQGLGYLTSFRKRAASLAKAAGFKKFELCGVGMYNETLRERMHQRGYAPCLEIAPIELGNELTEFMLKQFEVS